ncbi:3-methyl-2-oxobutanoate hydroxymethyltransferase [Phaeobacter sp. C3_T13_0]|uniref:3-methyl-2-oxobutanoate hydroxymethyltransferase n=1 Tax=Phaeobacter cretensis TaxID=3342641 RepID=UPI0039BC8A09
MKRIYDWDAGFSLRNYTASDLRELKGIRKLVQTTANTTEEAAAAKDAGAFSVEAEVICDRVMAEISARTSLITSSLGSGASADIIYLFQNDICGEQPESPRHARAFGDLNSLYEQI